MFIPQLGDIGYIKQILIAQVHLRIFFAANDVATVGLFFHQEMLPLISIPVIEATFEDKAHSRMCGTFPLLYY